jgi:hypothetical protein
MYPFFVLARPYHPCIRSSHAQPPQATTPHRGYSGTCGHTAYDHVRETRGSIEESSLLHHIATTELLLLTAAVLVCVGWCSRTARGTTSSKPLPVHERSRAKKRDPQLWDRQPTQHER